MSRKAELYLDYQHEREALEAVDRRIAEGEPRPANYDELVAAVEAAHRAWTDQDDAATTTNSPGTR